MPFPGSPSPWRHPRCILTPCSRRELVRDADAITQPRAGLSPDCADPSPRPVLPPFLFQMNNQTHRPQADVVLSQLAGFSAGPAPALFPPVARPPQCSQPRCLLAAGESGVGGAPGRRLAPADSCYGSRWRPSRRERSLGCLPPGRLQTVRPALNLGLREEEKAPPWTRPVGRSLDEHVLHTTPRPVR